MKHARYWWLLPAGTVRTWDETSICAPFRLVTFMRDDLGYFDDETGDGDRRIGVSQEHDSSKRVRPFLHYVLV